MKRLGVALMVFFLAVSVTMAGCTQKAASSREAIDTAKMMKTTQEQTKYLIAQGKAFINSDDFQGAIDVLQYVLTYLDKDSPEAKALLQKAKDDLAAQLKQKAEDVKKSFGDFGK